MFQPKPRRRRALIAALAAILGGNVGAAAVAATLDAAPPVAVGPCSADVYAAGTQVEREPASVGYQFTNLRDVAATSVVTKISYGNASWYFEDRGTFSKHAAIDRTMIGALPVNIIAPMTCEIARVDYADGTTWESEAAIVSINP